jgi:hypothetical protein
MFFLKYYFYFELVQKVSHSVHNPECRIFWTPLKKKYKFIISLFLLFPVLLSCNNGFENYSTDPNDLLTFSQDTLAFDTIITTVNTPFQRFMIYNTHAKPLLISSIFLENGEKSGFRINVDGKAGFSFQEVEIRGNDSIFVLVNAKPAENNSNQPKHIADNIIFITNGIQQKVLLEAVAQDAFIWRGAVIDSNFVFSNLKPFVIYDSLVIKEGVTAEWQEGSVFYMHSQAEIIVNGTLKAKGTLENPIIIRGDRFDRMVGISYDSIPGQWGGIRFGVDSYNSEMEYVYIRNGIFGMNFEPATLFQPKLKMKNVIITNFKGTLIRAVNCYIEAENCELSNSKGLLLDLAGGQYRFTHCTIANYYYSNLETGWGNSDNETVYLSSSYYNKETDAPEYYPIEADFYNTIIWGIKNFSTSKIKVENESKASLSYSFRNCLLNIDSNLISTATDCLINADPRFTAIGDKNLFYDFRLDSLSPARNKAYPEISREIPYDIKGIDRFLDEGPDIGAYEYH